MKEERTEGIVLKTFDYKEKERILTVFTPYAGILSIIAKKIKNSHSLALTTPFCQAEFLLFKGKSDLFKLQEGILINDHSFLRAQFSYLQTAAEMVKIILKTQLPGKPSPKLYELLLAYLSQLPNFTDVTPLMTSFYLKLLTHEGLVSWASPSDFPLSVSDREWSQLKHLALIRSFKEMHSINLSPELGHKIKDQLPLSFF